MKIRFITSDILGNYLKVFGLKGLSPV